MNKYEIINPSDKCFISSDNEKIAQFCCLFVGNGKYGLKDMNTGKTVLDLLIFGGAKEFIKKAFGDAKQFLTDNVDDVIKCCDSFEYSGVRTSLNNIEAQFKWFRDEVQKQYKKGEQNGNTENKKSND